MVLGIGIDQCDVPRMRRQLETPANGFVEAVFLPAEISYCLGKHRPAEHFAARFAAKEAALKALAVGGGEGTFWLDIEIVNEPGGRPRLELSGRLRALAEELGAGRIHLSLTHTAETAAAVVIAED
jgi:holo-[acyl-carrier protein] synthase